MWKGLILLVLLIAGTVTFGQQSFAPQDVNVTAIPIAIITDIILDPSSPNQFQTVSISVQIQNVGNQNLCILPNVNITNSTNDLIFSVGFEQQCLNPLQEIQVDNLSVWYTNASPIGQYNASAQAQYSGPPFNETKTTSIVTKAFSIVTKVSQTPPPSGPGGGGPAPTTPPPTTVAPTPPPEPCIKDRFNIVGPELARCILEERQLTAGTFYVLPRNLSAPAAVSGLYTVPSDPIVRAGLPIPLEITPVSIYEESASVVLLRFTNATTVLLARGDLAVDSMAAVAYAKAENIPILLTEPGALPKATLDAITLLGPTNILIIGGEVAVSRAVESELSEHWDVGRIWGESRYETAVELASMINDPEIVVVTDGNTPSVDAILVSAEYQAPLIYVNGEIVPQAVRRYLLEHRETSTGENLKVVAVGVEKKALIEVQGLVTLPKFLVEIEVFSRLYQVIMGIIS